MSQTFASSLLEVDPNRPFCLICNDNHVIRSRDGRTRVCPACACQVCQRLKYTHVDLGGCTCHEDKQEEKRNG
jgi:hypothetical protein